MLAAGPFFNHDGTVQGPKNYYSHGIAVINANRARHQVYMSQTESPSMSSGLQYNA